MRNIITGIVLNLMLVTVLVSTAVAQQNYSYDFRNTFNEVSGAGPTLNVLGTGAFVNEGLEELSCISRPVYGFTQNSGVQFDNGAANDFIGSAYSIEMYFQFLSNSGYMRIIDFKNQTSDSGVYSTANLLLFYDEITVNTTAFAANQYVHLVVTRESASEVINMYVDGVLAGSFIDNLGNGLLDSSNVLNFFVDDLVSGGEARPGRIALLKIYDTPLDSAAVADNFNSLQTESGTLVFSTDINAACILGNVFNFTNLSDNVGSYTYTWDFGDGIISTDTNSTHSYTASGIYNVNLIADNGIGCIDTVTSQVEVYSAAQVNLGADQILCAGDSAVLDAGSGFSSYLWSNGSIDPSITVNVSGIVSIEVTDSTGCVGVDTVIVDVVPFPLLELGMDVFLCFGETLILNATPGLASYSWSTGDTTESVLVSAAGVYTVEVTNAAGCSVSDTISVTINPEIIFSLGADTSLCDGNTLTLDPGTGFQSFTWSDGSVLPTLEVTNSGTYFVEAVDLFGCTATDSINVVVNSLPVVDLGADTTFCGGNPVVLDPGSSFVGYQWSNGSQDPVLVVSISGTFSVIVTDVNGCNGTDTIVLDATPAVSLGPDQILCSGVITTLDAGAGLNSYLWSNGSITQTIDVTTSGTFTVTVSDISGCTNEDEVVVLFNNPPVIDLGPDFDICDGEIGILDPGAGYLSYLWSDGSSSPTLQVTVAGTYSVTVSSASNCDDSDNITINVLPAPVVTLGNDTILCSGETITLDAGSGFSSYLWSDGSTNQTLDVTSFDMYMVTVTGSNGCENTDSIIVSFENTPIIDLGPDQAICSGSSVLLDAGPGLLSYLWSDNSISQSIMVTAGGLYAVTVTNFAGCSSMDSVAISVMNSPVVNLGLDTTLCSGLQLVLDAGAGFNSYLWNDGSSTQTFNVTSTGIYTVTITDLNSCTNSDAIFVDFYAPVPTPVITQLVNTLQSNSASGNQWYSVPGGLIPGETGQNFTPGQDGTYYVIVTDSNGCASQPSANIIFVIDGLPSLSDSQITLFPNPVDDLVTVSIIGLQGNTFRLEVLDILGKTVYLDESISSGNHKMDVSTFVEGVYFVKMSSGASQVVQRLVINR